jgi:aspartyl-tRNA synthetase
MLGKRANECGVELSTIKNYLEAFKHGSVPHGGLGVGMERVVMLYLNLGNVRKTSMFPRDAHRLEP